MKILLVCAGGMSTSILMQKMTKHWNDLGEELKIQAIGMGEYKDQYTNYDIIMVGPQIAYKVNEIKSFTNKPTEAIPSLDYAIGNCANIYELAKKLYNQI